MPSFMSQTRKPNFLFIITDQHRADHIGCYGHPVIKTPNIDSIATRGRMFDNFYVACAICQPNRSTLMTGRMPSLHGVRHNGVPLDRRFNIFVDLMRVQGYSTALIGKSHLMNMESVYTYEGTFDMHTLVLGHNITGIPAFR